MSVFLYIHYMKTHYRYIFLRLDWLKLIYLLIFIFLLFPAFQSSAQCPTNIDFEKGDFTGWECYTGEVKGDGSSGLNYVSWDRTSPGPPVRERQTMYSSNPGDGLDPYGSFPVNCPNGSGHSIRLGNDGAAKQAEAISYTFTIPLGKNDFSIYFQYALVLQDPGHLAVEQPRFVVTVDNLTDGNKTACQLAAFVSGGSLVGFEISPLSLPMATIRYKKWAAASVNLDGLAGKTIRIEFRTSDCTLGGHFGYAYLDIESNCDGNIAGSTFCSSDPVLNLTAPAGFAGYRWFNTSNTTLGNQQVLTFNPLPPSGAVVYVELTPYNGYGCVDTLTAYLWDTLTVIANAGPDKEFCVNNAVQLGGAPKPGLVYTWLPTAGLSDANTPNPVVTPNANIQYTLRASSVGGGCQATDAVNLVKKCDVIEFYVPNAFTPGGNTTNNRLRPFLYGYSKVNYFRVYNRYGQLLYSANSDTPGWDGTYKGKAQSTQTVVWMIEAVDAYGRTERRQGSSILLR